MKNVGLILILILAVALFVSVLASINTAPELQLTRRDQSTGPYNPNQPSDEALPRGV